MQLAQRNYEEYIKLATSTAERGDAEAELESLRAAERQKAQAAAAAKRAKEARATAPPARTSVAAPAPSKAVKAAVPRPPKPSRPAPIWSWVSTLTGGAALLAGGGV